MADAHRAVVAVGVPGARRPAVPARPGLEDSARSEAGGPPREAPRAPSSAPRRFRPEIQGLRSLAVLMVLTSHLFLDRVSGGVDIFLMLSAFLLTLSFTRKVEEGRPLALGRHWLHRFKRLVPAAAATIVGTLAAAWLWLPPSRWAAVIDQAWASVLYVQNWLLATTAVDYYASDDSLASPLQHFWSLSIQGQVFLLWPLVLAGGAWLSPRSAACEVPLEQALAPENPALPLAGIPGLHLVDLTDRLCPDGVCRPVIGNVHATSTTNHLTADHSATLAADMRERLLAAAGW